MLRALQFSFAGPGLHRSRSLLSCSSRWPGGIGRYLGTQGEPWKCREPGCYPQKQLVFVYTPLKFNIPKMMVWKMYLLSCMAILGIYVDFRGVFGFVAVLQGAAAASEQRGLPCRSTPSSFSGELQNLCRATIWQ